VTNEAIRVLHALTELDSSLKFEIESHDFGGIAIDNHGNPLPQSTLDACKAADAILMGAVGEFRSHRSRPLFNGSLQAVQNGELARSGQNKAF
jgi:isocitrate/isopropylmalate dehydrogenase